MSMKQMICILLCITILFLCGCGIQNGEKSEKQTSMFVVADEGSVFGSYLIVYHRDTKVMYAVSAGINNSGCFTVLLNPDGSPMIWEG